MISRPCAPYRACIWFSQGNERRQGAHHDAQKSTQRSLPLTSPSSEGGAARARVPARPRKPSSNSATTWRRRTPARRSLRRALTSSIEMAILSLCCLLLATARLQCSNARERLRLTPRRGPNPDWIDNHTNAHIIDSKERATATRTAPLRQRESGNDPADRDFATSPLRTSNNGIYERYALSSLALLSRRRRGSSTDPRWQGHRESRFSRPKTLDGAGRAHARQRARSEDGGPDRHRQGRPHSATRDHRRDRMGRRCIQGCGPHHEGRRHGAARGDRGSEHAGGRQANPREFARSRTPRRSRSPTSRTR